MTMRQRGWTPSADRAHRPAGAAPSDTMQIVVDSPSFTRLPLAGVPPAPSTHHPDACRPRHAGAACVHPGSLTSDVVPLEVTT